MKRKCIKSTILKALTSLTSFKLNSVEHSSFSKILAAILDHITDHVDCGLMLFVPHGFCFVFENNMVDCCRTPIHQAGGSWDPLRENPANNTVCTLYHVRNSFLCRIHVQV